MAQFSFAFLFSFQCGLYLSMNEGRLIEGHAILFLSDFYLFQLGNVLFLYINDCWIFSSQHAFAMLLHVVIYILPYLSFN